MRGIKDFFYLLLISYFEGNIVKIALDYNKRGYKAPFIEFMQLCVWQIQIPAQN